MIWSQGSKSIDRSFLISIVFLFAVSGFAAAQDKDQEKEKKSSAPATSKSAPASKPAPEAKPGSSTGAKPGGTTAGTPGSTTGSKPGGTTNTISDGAAGAKPGGASYTKAPSTVNRPGGGKSITNARGDTTNFNTNGLRTSVETSNGTRANFDRGGRVSSIHTRNGLTINYGAGGERRFVSVRPRGGRVVGFGYGRGFVERSYYRGGRPSMQRTYFYGGRSYAYSYRGYYWRGRLYYGFVPAFYYAPAFYGWAYNPWATPIAFGWGWGGAAWFGFYGYYFAPAPFYVSPAFWLTDYLIAANLQAAYEAGAAAQANANGQAAADDQAASGGGSVGLSPEVKQQIADEVRAQIAAQRDAAAQPAPAGAVTSNPPAGGLQNDPDELPAALDPAHRTFIVSAVLASPLPDGTECSLSPGDVLTRIQDTPDADQKVKVIVASSQKNDCASGSQIAVAVQDLQDMHNDFQAKINEGLGKLAENQGKNGMPAGPASGAKANPDGQAQSDPTVEADLKAQQDEANQAEKEVQDASASGSANDD